MIPHAATFFVAAFLALATTQRLAVLEVRANIFRYVVGTDAPKVLMQESELLKSTGFGDGVRVCGKGLPQWNASGREAGETPKSHDGHMGTTARATRCIFDRRSLSGYITGSLPSDYGDG